jgi:hypothetical protein
VSEGVPPVAVTESEVFEPLHIVVLATGCTVMEGSGTTVTVAELEYTVLQSLPVAEIIQRYE